MFRPFPTLLRAFLALTLSGLMGGQAAGQPATSVVRTDQVTAELLIHAPDGVAAGRTVWLGLQISHARDWHTYWKNPGDSGLPTQLTWTLPAGVSAGDIQWPAPKKFPIGHLANYGYEGRVLLPVPLTVGAGFSASTLNVGLDASWLVCRKECIPEEGRFSLQIPASGTGQIHARAFEDAATRVPRVQAGVRGHVAPQPKQVTVQVEGLPADWQQQPLEFFPELAGVIEPGAAWSQRWEDARWLAEIPLSSMRSESPSLLPVVLVRRGDVAPGENALGGLRLELPARGDWPALPVLGASAGSELPPALQAALDANAARASAGSANAGNTLSLGLALLGALVGGLLLNLMPCVFPVLAIKVLAFTRPSTDGASHRRSGLAYTAGVVLSFVALGGLLLGLRAAGEQIGWGFQLQNPAVVAALAVLFTLIGLNLAGLFEFGHVLPSRLASWQARSPSGDAFLTGVLATAVASPCTAPFMGASLGLAVGLPAAQALAVFATMGLGLALPYLAASWLPGITRALPRPGEWMNTLRQFLAFPMFATVVWLLWVLAQQSGPHGVGALLGVLVAVAWLVWALGRKGRTRWVMGAVAASALATVLAWLGPAITRESPNSQVLTSTDVQTGTWQAWSPERMAQWQAQGRPVFVDYTAAWCVTCQFNKNTTLADLSLLAEFNARGVVLARADWTRRDPAVTQALAALGRTGVPVYALYQGGRPVRVLSEILSVPEVRAALQAL